MDAHPQPSDPPEGSAGCFKGYLRENGDVSTRNYIAVIATLNWRRARRRTYSAPGRLPRRSAFDTNRRFNIPIKNILCTQEIAMRCRVPIRVITEYAWHRLFARHMFVRADWNSQAGNHVPEFTVINTPSLQADPATDGTTSGTYILMNFGIAQKSDLE